MTPRGPALPHDVEVELRRIGVRWAQLPADRADAAAILVRRLAQDLADAGSGAGAGIPDLGAAAAYDQLRVTTYDAAAAGVPPEHLAALLTGLRRRLSRQDY